ncbi:MAG: sensor histidine kinase [Bacteroidales bacterium]
MGFNKISWKRLLLIVLIIALSAVGGALFTGDRADLAVLPVLAVIALVYSLLTDMHKSIKSLEQFFESAGSGDFSTTFSENDQDPLIRRLHVRMNQLMLKIRELRVKMETGERFYHAILQQSATGLVVFNSRNEIEVINRAASRFAGISTDSTDRRLLQIRNPHFFEQLTQLGPGENITFRGEGPESSGAFLLRASEIEITGERLNIVSIENIQRELDQTELESYQRLIRVLTHEIMNAVAPLTSVSGTLQKRFVPDQIPIDPSKVDEKLIRGLVQGLSTIDDQTRGMVEFVNNYRKLTKLPEPVIVPLQVTDWLEKLGILTAEQLEKEEIRLILSVDPAIRNIHADKKLLSQVLLNLVNNAMDALRSKTAGKELRIEVFRFDPSHVYIRVSNNGVPIPEEDLKKIFIPFYTTKENGSGIGLYISRQIVHLHGGLLSVTSQSGETSFLIELPDFP